MARLSSGRKTQTRLSFSPLPISSPSRAQQPESIRDRVATVTLTNDSRSLRKRKTVRDYLSSPGTSSELVSHGNSQPSLDSPSQMTRSFMSRGGKAEKDTEKAQNPALLQMEEYGILDASESDTPVMHSSPTAKSRKRKLQVVESREQSASETESEPRSAKRRGKAQLDPLKLKTKILQSDNEEPDESDEEEDPLPVRRSRTRTQSFPNDDDLEQNQQDIDEDLEFLGDIDVDSPRGNRKTSTKKTAKQQALDALKKKRLQRVSSSDQIIEPSSRADSTQIEDISSDSGSAPSEATPKMDAADLDADDSDFVIEDDSDAAIGGPVELPFEFSRDRTKKPKELFKFAVEWMVQKKINPGFASEDPKYKIAFDRLGRFVTGLGSSKFVSTAWTPTFSKAVKTRPALTSHQFAAETLFRDRCDACNRSGHPATWEVTFSGNTYDPRTLEEESDDENESDEESKPGEVFYIGRFCMQNARTAHTLAHWQFHLNEWVVDYLNNIGELSPEKIVQRDRWKTSKRRKEADKIVERMESEGEIKALYRDFKNEVSEAQTSHDRSSSAYS